MTERADGVVVVGVDGSAKSVEALRFALDEGIRRGAAVEVVTAWLWDPAQREGKREEGRTVTSREEAGREAQRMQDRVVSEVLSELDQAPPVSQTVAHGYGADILREAARRASVLVVGHTPRGFRAHTVLGSVSEACLRHAPVPVLVVPGDVDSPAGEPDEIAGPVAAGFGSG